MITLIIGNPDSGKSALAEDIALASECRNRIYLATMKVCDDEGRQRVIKHRSAREGKGFVTLEIPYGVAGALDKMEDPADTVVLLECISNLVGNEMHDDPEAAVLCQPDARDAEAFINLVTDDIRTLAAGVNELIIVTNEYEDDESYDDETRLYIELCKRMNRELAGIADEVKDIRKR